MVKVPFPINTTTEKQPITMDIKTESSRLLSMITTSNNNKVLQKKKNTILENFRSENKNEDK